MMPSIRTIATGLGRAATINRIWTNISVEMKISHLYFAKALARGFHLPEGLLYTAPKAMAKAAMASLGCRLFRPRRIKKASPFYGGCL